MFDFHVSTQTQDMRLCAAMLVYGGQDQYGRRQATATVHDVSMIADRPSIMAGRLVTEADLANLAGSLASAQHLVETQWLDTRVLARGPDRTIWWSAPCVRSMFFEVSKHNKNTFDGNGRSPVPGLVWMARPGDGLYVYAVRGNERPTRETQLFQAPFFNVWGRGKVCLGNAQLPSENQQGDLDAWESVLFGSRFSHPNFTQKDRLVAGIDPCQFWQGMLKQPPRAFPEKRLVQVPLTMESLLSVEINTVLQQVPRPKGEF